MRRLYAWITGAAGGVAAYRLFRRRDETAEEVAEPEPGPDPRAEELRARLAETRAEEPAAAPPGPAVEETPEERRRRVHEQARGAIDEMQ